LLRWRSNDDKILELVVQQGAKETDTMPAKIPITSEERKRLLQSYSHLPSKDKEMFSKAAGHLRWLTILWDLDELDPDSMPSISDRRHILLAYKLLQVLWFNKLPESGSQAFTMYVRDRLPDDQTPERVNEAFDRSAHELADLCEDMPRPKWLKNATIVMTSVELFPKTSR
jgi:hypothetical protein